MPPWSVSSPRVLPQEMRVVSGAVFSCPRGSPPAPRKVWRGGHTYVVLVICAAAQGKPPPSLFLVS